MFPLQGTLKFKTSKILADATINTVYSKPVIMPLTSIYI